MLTCLDCYTLSCVLTDFCRVCNRLDMEKSYINGHIYRPDCVRTSALATICRCEDGHSVFNCTTDDKAEKVRIFRTKGTDDCSSWDGFVGRRRQKRSFRVREATDDDIILDTDLPPPPPDTTDIPQRPRRRWPTKSGITVEDAEAECQRRMERSPAYNVSQQYVKLDSVATSCKLNIQACRLCYYTIRYDMLF